MAETVGVAAAETAGADVGVVGGHAEDTAASAAAAVSVAAGISVGTGWGRFERKYRRARGALEAG